MATEDFTRDVMRGEAIERLRLMESHYQEQLAVLIDEKVDKKIVVDHVQKSVRRADITDDEYRMIKDFENQYGYFVYYLIEDEGRWPDGCSFKRYTMPYVGPNEEEYDFEKEEVIKRCGNCPAYVVNTEDSSASEFTEFAFQNVGKMIINVS